MQWVAAPQHPSAVQHLTLRDIQASQASVISYIPMAVCVTACTSNTTHLCRGDDRVALAGGRTAAWEPAARKVCGRMRARGSCTMHSTYEFRGIRAGVCVYANAFWYCFLLRACRPNPRGHIHPPTHVCCGREYVSVSVSGVQTMGYNIRARARIGVLKATVGAKGAQVLGRNSRKCGPGPTRDKMSDVAKGFLPYSNWQ